MPSLSKGAMVAMVGALVTLVSIFMNWYSYDFLGTAITLKPWEVSTGKLLLVVSLLAAAMAYMGSTKSKKGMYTGTGAMGVIVILVVMANYPGSDFEGISIEMGFWLSLVGGIVTTVGGVMGMMGMKKA